MSDPAPKIYSRQYFLTAGECNAEGDMPLTLLAARIIECATCHANSLGIGYADLIKLDLAWVLSRISIEIISLPKINDTYILNTWIEGTNRLFSERCFSITSPDGKVYAYARSTWAAISISTRRAANPSILGDVMFPTDPPHCPISDTKRTLQIDYTAEERLYTFCYSDLDFNRHVNTVRYINLILDGWDLDWYDNQEIARFDISFRHECHFGETVTVCTKTDTTGFTTCDLLREGNKVLSANILWRKK